MGLFSPVCLKQHINYQSDQILCKGLTTECNIPAYTWAYPRKSLIRFSQEIQYMFLWVSFSGFATTTLLMDGFPVEIPVQSLLLPAPSVCVSSSLYFLFLTVVSHSPGASLLQHCISLSVSRTWSFPLPPPTCY